MAPIPKRIIQIARDVNLPLRNRAAVTNIKLLNPDYEYLFFDNVEQREFIAREFPQYLEVFDSYRFIIQRCDFFRYLAVYFYGGFYFDVDFFLVLPLTDLLEHSCVFPFEAITLSHFMRTHLGMDWQIGNYAFGASPRHFFLEKIIRNCVRAQHDPKWVKPMMRGSPPLLGDDFWVINSTGPGLVSRTLAQNQELAKTVTVLFPEDVCDVANSWNRFGEFGIHLMHNSWQKHMSFIPQKFSSYCWRYMQLRSLRRARQSGKSRFYPEVARFPQASQILDVTLS